MTVERLNRHRSDLERLWSLASRELEAVVLSVRRMDVAEAREVLKVALPDLMDPFLGAASDLSAVLLDELYQIAVDVPASTYLPSEGKIDRIARWAVTPMANDGLDSSVLSRLLGSAERMLYDADRLTVVEGVTSNYYARKSRKYGLVTRDRDGSRVKFQRFPRANACDFCKMLAARGDVYNTAASAGGVVGRGSTRTGYDSSGKRLAGGIGGGVKARGKRALGSTHYHDDCRCIVQPVISGTEIAEYAGEVQRKYLDEYRGAFTDAAGNALTTESEMMSRWRELQKQD